MREILLGLIGCAAFGLVAASAGCGGDVKNGGSGGGSASSGTSSTASGGGGVTCQEACQKMAQVGCGDAQMCAVDCQQAYDEIPACQKEFDALLQCIFDNATGGVGGCKPAACDEVDNAMETCADAQSCDQAPCAVSSDGACDCESTCMGQTRQAACQPMPDGSIACTCSAGGMQVGTCTENAGSTLACDLTEGCCSSYFGDGGP